jgi:hypothetical protein
MRCYPRGQRWKVVPADFIPELRQAGLPVDVMEHRSRSAVRPLVTVRRRRNRLCRNGALRELSTYRLPSGELSHPVVSPYNSIRELAAQPHGACLPDGILDA